MRQGQLQSTRRDSSSALRLYLETALHEPAQYCALIDNLMRVASSHSAIDDARQDDERDMLLARIRNSVDRIGQTRTESGYENAGRIGRRGITRRHDRRTRLLSRQEERDARFVQRGDQRDDLTTRHAEGLPGSVICDRLSHDVGNAHLKRQLILRQQGRLHHCGLSAMAIDHPDKPVGAAQVVADTGQGNNRFNVTAPGS